MVPSVAFPDRKLLDIFTKINIYYSFEWFWDSLRPQGHGLNLFLKEKYAFIFSLNRISLGSAS